MNNFDLATTIEAVKSRGYWKLIIEPTKILPSFFEHIRDGAKFIDESSIKLRGWDYPHVPTEDNEHQKIEIMNDRVNGFIKWNHFVESWSIFESGQFVHLLGLREDWFRESDWFSEEDRLKKIEPMKYLDFVGTTLTPTEMFLFMKNLINSGKYGDSIKVHISIHNVSGRVLTTFDPGRLPLFFEYKTSSPEIPWNKTISKEELNDSYLALAESIAVNIFKFFKGFNPPIQVIKDDQKRLMERRL